MSKWSPTDLALAAVATLQDVLVHQRARWASLFAHQHQYEGWWKAEFALALESWCWRMDLPEPTWVRTEVKPRDYGVGATGQSIDILVGRWSQETHSLINDPPLVWIELKERATWWGNPWKALCEDNRSLGHDLAKWREAEWRPGDVVLACQIISHDAARHSSEPLPPAWAEVLEEVAKKSPRFVPPRSVCCPCFSPDTGEPVNRFATIEFFTSRGAEFIPGRKTLIGT